MKKKIFVALDNSEISDALNITKEIKDYIAGIKLGLEFFTKNGPKGIEAFSVFNIPIFLELKLLKPLMAYLLIIFQFIYLMAKILS